MNYYAMVNSDFINLLSDNESEGDVDAETQQAIQASLQEVDNAAVITHLPERSVGKVMHPNYHIDVFYNTIDTDVQLLKITISFKNNN